MNGRLCIVLGCGTPRAGDDAAGLELVERLRRAATSGCDLRLLPAGGLDLIELFQQAASLVLVDSVSSGAKPGTLHVTPLPGVKLAGRHAERLSSHAWGLEEAMDIARGLGGRVPPVILIGIEIAVTTPGTSLSPQVSRALDYLEAHFDEVRRMALDRFSRARTVVVASE